MTAEEGPWHIARISYIVRPWEELNRVASIKVVRFSYVVTILVPSLAAAAAVWNRSLGASTGIELSVPTGLLLAYLASLLAASATIITETACPRRVKEHGSLRRYATSLRDLARIARERDSLFQQNLIESVGPLLPALAGLSEDLDEAYRREFVNAVAAAVKAGDAPSIVRFLENYEGHWRAANESLVVVRWVVTVLYLSATCIGWYLLYVKAFTMFL